MCTDVVCLLVYVYVSVVCVWFCVRCFLPFCLLLSIPLSTVRVCVCVCVCICVCVCVCVCVCFCVCIFVSFSRGPSRPLLTLHKQQRKSIYDDKSFALVGKLIAINPDFYTLWNYRRNIYLYFVKSKYVCIRVCGTLVCCGCVCCYLRMHTCK